MFKQGKAFLRIISYLQRLKGILFTITHLYTLFFIIFTNFLPFTVSLFAKKTTLLGSTSRAGK